MKYSAVAILAAASGAVAASNGTVYVTETLQSIVTYCPAATQITHGTQTYTMTAPGTLTITDCPCTVTRPVTKPSPGVSGPGVSGPGVSGPAPPFGGSSNSTGTAQQVAPTGGLSGTSKAANPTESGAAPTGGSGSSNTVPAAPAPTSGANKIASLSTLAGVVGLAAFFL